MSYSFLKTILVLFLLVFLVQIADRYFFNSKLTHVGPVLVKKPASYVYTKLENTRFFLRGIANIRNLVSENDNLKKENLALISQLAGYEDIKKENDFLKSALNIAPRFKGKVVYADIFSSRISPDGYNILLTKGVKDGINDNDIVITEDSVLVGKIKKSYDNFAHVLVVSDPDFSVTAKVLSSDTAGMARGALNKGLYLDLIVQSDSIKEGDVIVTSGTDFFPPALVVGRVSYVEASETDLFKEVKIKPALDEVRMGRVLIISH